MTISQYDSVSSSMLLQSHYFFLFYGWVTFHMYHILFIHSSVDGHLGCFHVLAIVNSTALTLVCIYFFELWEGQFSFQSQRKAMQKNAQTTKQLHSSHTLAKWCSKFTKPGFSNTSIVNFQIFKLVFENAEEPEIKLPTSAGSSKKQEFQKKHLFLPYCLCQSLWMCESQ